MVNGPTRFFEKTLVRPEYEVTLRRPLSKTTLLEHSQPPSMSPRASPLPATFRFGPRTGSLTQNMGAGKGSERTAREVGERLGHSGDAWDEDSNQRRTLHSKERIPFESIRIERRLRGALYERFLSKRKDAHLRLPVDTAVCILVCTRNTPGKRPLTTKRTRPPLPCIASKGFSEPGRLRMAHPRK